VGGIDVTLITDKEGMQSIRSRSILGTPEDDIAQTDKDVQRAERHFLKHPGKYKQKWPKTQDEKDKEQENERKRKE